MTQPMAGSAKPGAGCAYHSSAEPKMHMRVNSRIHGLRRPAASAMAPSGGLNTATISALPASA